MKPRVLLLDDDPAFRKALEFALEKFGLQPLVATSRERFFGMLDGEGGTAGLDLSGSLNADAPPQLLMIDLELGDWGSGFDVISEIRARGGAASRIPIIVVSGSEDGQAVTHALELGADDFVLKPLDKSLLASKLAHYIASDQLQEERAPALDLGESRVTAKLKLPSRLHQVDELGVRLLSPHLISRGTVLRLSGEWVRQVSDGKETTVMVTVASTWMEPGATEYSTYAEFDDASADFSKSVRLWLAARAATPVK